MGNLVLPYFDRNAWWRLAQKTQAQYFVMDTSSMAASDTTTSASGSSIGLVTQPIATSTDTALQVIAVAMASQIVPMTNQASGTNGIASYYFGGEFELSYHQPQPPASGTGVNAATAGTLALRNKIFTQHMMIGSAWTANGADTAGDTQVLTQPANEIMVVFEDPVTIVGSSLFTGFRLAENSFTLNVWNRTQVLVRPVHITTQQYVNLVALATGQATLSPTILG